MFKSCAWSMYVWTSTRRFSFCQNHFPADKTKPTLTVSPLWPSPGDSVTLSCSVGGPSAGWRFYWYEAAAKRSNGSRSYELLPGSGKGTEEGSFIVRGPTHTAGYKCRARREGLGYYTDYSQPKFVWFGGQCVCSFLCLFFLSSFLPPPFCQWLPGF